MTKPIRPEIASHIHVVLSANKGKGEPVVKKSNTRSIINAIARRIIFIGKAPAFLLEYSKHKAVHVHKRDVALANISPLNSILIY